MIHVENLTKSYRLKGRRHFVFRDLSFEIPEKANLGILGVNGAGKSTLLRILGGIDQPDYGERTARWYAASTVWNPERSLRR